MQLITLVPDLQEQEWEQVFKLSSYLIIVEHYGRNFLGEQTTAVTFKAT